MPSREQIALALQGFGAGMLGQGPQFQKQLATQREREAERARIEQIRGAEMRQKRAQAAAQDLTGMRQLLDRKDYDGAMQLAGNRAELLGQLDPNANISDTLGIRDAIASKDYAEADRLVNLNIGRAQAGGYLEVPNQEATAGQREFESLTAGLPEEQKQEARLIKLGLSSRAVGSAIQTIAEKDLAEIVGDASATIKQREKFGEMTGSSRAKSIDKGFERLVKIDAGVRNIDRAITALSDGAGVGAIEGLLPSITAASKTLDNIQGSMALDVVGATTFGALSKGELDLAKEIALPTGLNTQELIQFLQEKKSAQQKLSAYFNEQIQHLDMGGTVASFLRKKERESGGQDEQPTTQAQPSQQGQDLSGLSLDDLIKMRQQAR